MSYRDLGTITFDAEQEPHEGGQALVYKGFDKSRDMAPVAIKILRHANNRFMAEALNRELNILNRLQHEHIITLLDFGTEPETERKYLVLEWASQTLDERVKEATYDSWPNYYREVGGSILSALRYAYRHGVVHRDLKPANVLFTEDGTLKVADFGIGKYQESIQPGMTLRDFRSKPYAPPEEDQENSSDGRDVWGFVVLSIQCFSDKTLASYEDVRNALESVKLPKNIADLFEDCLALDKSQRPENIIEFCEQLNKAHKPYEDEEEFQTCFISFTPGVVSHLCKELGQPDAEKAKAYVIRDLNELRGIRHWRSEPKHAHLDQDDAFAIFTPQFRLKVVPDSTVSGHLRVVLAWLGEADVMENAIDSSWQPNLLFRPGRPVIGNDYIENVSEFFQLGVDAYEAEARKQKFEDEVNRIFVQWGNILRAKQKIEELRADAIPYSSFSVEGNRVQFSTVHPQSADILNEERLVKVPQGRDLTGVVVSVKRNNIELHCEELNPELIPIKGEILVDTRLSEIAIRRQNVALDAVRYGRSARNDLGDLLRMPANSESSGESFEGEYFQSDLDDFKKAAISKALSSKDFLALEGPPGTGKTKFICELIAQQLKLNPASRILLVSQTHVALDNALERTTDFFEELKAVRIGRSGDPRISEKVHPFLLDQQSDYWFARSREQTKGFLNAWAEEKKLPRTDIELARLVKRLRLSRQTVNNTQERLLNIDSVLGQQESELESQEERQTGNTYFELKEKYERNKTEAQELRQKLKICKQEEQKAIQILASHSEDGKTLTEESVDELLAWENALVQEDSENAKFLKLLDLVEEWHFRFANPKHFYPAILIESQLVAGTCIGFQAPWGSEKIEYDLCIIDEASKSTPSECLVPMAQSRKWALVGDEKQLPPYVDDELSRSNILDDFGLSEEDLSQTIFGKLLAELPDHSRSSLLIQYRMVEPIGELISDCFYEGKLQSARLNWVRDFELAGISCPVTWLSTSSLPNHRERRTKTSYLNPCEATQVEELLKRLEFVAGKTKKSVRVAVLVGYAAQKDEIQNRIHSLTSTLECVRVECNTVDAFQGRETDVAIYSVTRSNSEGAIGFLSERSRLNVALSRARDKLVVIGDHAFCRNVRGKNPFYSVLSHIDNSPNCEVRELEA